MISGFKTTPQFKLPKLEYVGRYFTGSDQSTYLSTNFDFGAAHPTKEVFAVVITTDEDSTGSRAYTNRTIKGHAATSHGFVGTASHMECFSAPVPEGGLGTIGFSILGSNPAATTCSIFAWTVIDRFKSDEAVLPSSVFIYNNLSAPVVNVNIPAWGFGLLGKMQVGNAGLDTTLSGGWTEDFDIDLGGNVRTTVGHKEPVPQLGAYPCTANGGFSDGYLGAWIFR